MGVLRASRKRNPFFPLFIGTAITIAGIGAFIAWDQLNKTSPAAAKETSPYGNIAMLNRVQNDGVESFSGLANELANSTDTEKTKVAALTGAVRVEPNPLVITPSEASKQVQNVSPSDFIAYAADPASVPAATAPAKPSMTETTADVAGTISADDQREMMARIATMVRQGDIAGARLILTRLDRIGNSRATFALAQTYDPVMLSQWKVFGIKPDGEKAVALYRRAIAGGVDAAREHLAALEAPAR